MYTVAGVQISLWQYLYCPDVAAHLHRAAGPCTDFNAVDYTLVISPDHFRSLAAACQDRKHVTSVARELACRVASDAGAELARVYEYQLALLGDGRAAAMLAGHAARCVVDYVIGGGRYLERDAVVIGAVKGHDGLLAPVPTVSVVVGERELKWRLDDILKKPGLRREIYVSSDDYQVIDPAARWSLILSLCLSLSLCVCFCAYLFGTLCHRQFDMILAIWTV